MRRLDRGLKRGLRPDAAILLALLAAVATALVLALWNNGFPLGYHSDEEVKIKLLEEGSNNFFHPLLMLQAVRLAGLLVDTPDAQALVELGRTVTAAFAALTVVASFLLLRAVGGTRLALWAAAAVAVMPTLVVHAHYLKEDLYLAPTVLLSLHAFLVHERRRDWRSLLWWGTTTGLALSSKYSALILLLLYFPGLRVLRVADPRASARDYWRMLVIAGAAFVVVNYPLLLDWENFVHGFGREISHAVKGHKIKVWPWEHLATFHLRFSLAPGMTWLWVALAALGIVIRLRRPGGLSSGDRLLMGFLVLWLGIAELSPTKPFPDFMRYVIPAVPVLAFYGVAALDAVGQAVARRLSARGGFLPAALLLLALAWPLYESLRLVDQFAHDTRDRVAALLGDPPPGTVLHERLTSTERYGEFAAKFDPHELRERGIEYMVVSSFNYERFRLGATMALQRDSVYRYAHRYERLFSECPYRSIRPTHKSYAFSSPEIRVIDIRDCMSDDLYSR